MTIRADNDPRFSRRFLFMGIAAIGFALYCLYDGLIGYPANRLKGFDEFKSDYKTMFAAPHYDPAISADEFEATADKEGRDTWSHYAHERDIKSNADIVMQFIMAGITTIAGVVLISIPIRRRHRWIELEENELRTSWGQVVPIDQIESINKRKWRDKGLAKISYLDGGGRKRTFVLDDMMFMRHPTDDILFEIEQRVGFERITGGPPEPMPGEEPVDRGEEEGGNEVASPA